MSDADQRSSFLLSASQPVPSFQLAAPALAAPLQSVHSPLHQLLDLISRKQVPELKGDSPALDDELVMKYINNIASSFSAPTKPVKQVSSPPGENKDSKFDFSVLLPKAELRDHPINHLWFSNKGECFGLDRSVEATKLSPPPSPVSDTVLPLSPTTPSSPSKRDVKPISDVRMLCGDKSLPFDLASYQDHTTPISDLTYNVLPFATSAKVLDLSSGGVSPKELQVDGIKLLDIWDVLGWFALDYMLTAEILAEDRNKHLLSFGNNDLLSGTFLSF